MSALVPIVRFIDWLNEKIGLLMGILTIIMVMVVFAIVVARYAFSTFWIGYQEIYVLLHGVTFMLGAGYCLLHEGHVRIDLIYSSAGKTYKAIIDILGSLFLALPLLWFIFDRSLQFIERSWPSFTEIITWTWTWSQLESSADLGIPGLYSYMKLTVALFCIVFGMQFVALILRRILDLAGIEVSPPNNNKEEGGPVA